MVRAREIVLDTGTRSQLPPIDGLEQIDYLCAENWLDREMTVNPPPATAPATSVYFASSEMPEISNPR